MICFPLYGPLSGFRNPEAALKVWKFDKANCDYESFHQLSLSPLSLLSLSHVFSSTSRLVELSNGARFDGIQN